MPDDDLDLIRKWVKPDPRQPGIAGVRAGYDLHVWSIVAQIDPQQDDPIAVLTAKFGVPREAIEAALLWYARYPEALAARAAAWGAASLAQMDTDILRVRQRVEAAVAKSRQAAA